jgi:hypothetical protein
MRLLLFFGLAFNCLASIWDPVLDFNAPNNLNASAVFSYGSGGSPGAFATLTTPVVDCIGTTTYCYNNGGAFPGAASVNWNGSGVTQSYLSIVQPVTFIDLDPETTAGVIVRFTAPWDDVYDVSGSFQAIDTSHHSTTGEIWVNNTNSFPAASLGVYGSSQPFNLTGLTLSAGDTIDFIVKSTSDCCYLATGLAGTITSATDGPAVPEPGTFALLGSALAAIGILRRRTARRA